MPYTDERKRKQRAEADDEERADDAARKKKRRAEAGDEGRADDAVRKKRQRAKARDKPVDERSKLYLLIKSRVTRLTDLDIAADDASLDKLNLDELSDLKKSLDKHLERESSQNFLPITIFLHIIIIILF
jgi:hypothetical protein